MVSSTLVCLYVVPTRLGWDWTPNQLSPNPPVTGLVLGYLNQPTQISGLLLEVKGHTSLPPDINMSFGQVPG